MKALILLICVLSIFSCSKANVQNAHHAAVKAGYDKLPIAKSMYEKFGGWSFIVHWNIPNDPKYCVEKGFKDWHTKTYIYDRYEMTYIQKVRLTANGGEVVEPVGQGKLYITEIHKIFGDSVAPSITPTNFQIIIDGSRLQKLVDSSWEFEAIDVKLNKNQPVKNINWEKSYWNRIYPLQVKQSL